MLDVVVSFHMSLLFLLSFPFDRYAVTDVTARYCESCLHKISFINTLLVPKIWSCVRNVLEREILVWWLVKRILHVSGAENKVVHCRLTKVQS
jgi:hypothetical protein